MKKLYKYLSPDALLKVFRPRGVTHLKASYPKEFNDPYELFLTLRTEGVDPAVLAFYQETVGDLPQWPTLCFSKHPDVIPMWAHYARECCGFVVEVDEGLLLKAYPEATTEDITYSSDPATISAEMVAHAMMTSKPRHTYFLQRSAIGAAYFAKSKVWSYESERRVVVGERHVTASGKLMLLRLPKGCVTAIIAGPHSHPNLRRAIKRVCTRIHCKHFKMHIARSDMRPYFTDEAKRSLIFDGEQLSVAENSCSQCLEPTDNDAGDKCPWCSITESHKSYAAHYNPMRLLAQHGLLDKYLTEVNRI